MELQRATGTPWIPKLTLENYLNLEHMDVISPAMLRKIIMMHGFNSNKVLKHDLLDAVRSIDLMDVHHSTLQSDVSSNAFLNLSDVIKDLSSLRWQECCITSIQTVNSENHFSSVVNDSSPISFKRNSNTASSLKDDSEAHKTQSSAFKKKMELQRATGTPWIPKLTLENYLNLEHMDVISPAMLRKIIMMHGFISNKVLKHDLLDAVRSIDLMDIHHSTLQSDVSSNAFLNLSDVIKDLSSLRWQECCITSIQTVNSENHFSSVVNDSSPISFKRNSNTASSLKDDSEAHKTQSSAFKKMKGNPSSASYGEQVDQDNSPKSCYEEPVDQIKITEAHSGKPMGQLLMLKGPGTKRSSQVNRRKARYEKQVGQANTPKARNGKQVREANTPEARYEEQVGQANISKAHNGEQVGQT